MIDIHCHILPSVDDGASSLEEAVQLARQAVQTGIHTVIATPHHHARGYMTDREQIIEAVAMLSYKLREESIPLRILPGQEIRVYEQLLDDLEHGNLQTLNNSRYILIEFPSSKVPSSVDELFYELRLLDKIPVIAHPERNSILLNNQERLAQIIADGALAQLTSSSIGGQLGRKLQKQSLAMCKAGLIHFIASDAHHAKHRPFDLFEGYQMVKKCLGDDFVNFYMANADNLIQDLPLIAEQPRPKRKVFQLW